MRQNSSFLFCEFIENYKFLESYKGLFTASSLKGFFRQSIRSFDVLISASGFRYFQEVTEMIEKVQWMLLFALDLDCDLQCWPLLSALWPTVWCISMHSPAVNPEVVARIVFIAYPEGGVNKMPIFLRGLRDQRKNQYSWTIFLTSSLFKTSLSYPYHLTWSTAYLSRENFIISPKLWFSFGRHIATDRLLQCLITDSNSLTQESR